MEFRIERTACGGRQGGEPDGEGVSKDVATAHRHPLMSVQQLV
ncbi:hypothetical protein [Streptomyces sp. SD31]